MKSKSIIKLSKSDVETMIKNLSLLVVSMDQMGSADFDDPEQSAVAFQEYFRKIRAFKILAGARKILCEEYGSQSSRADVEKLEEAAENLPYWKR